MSEHMNERTNERISERVSEPLRQRAGAFTLSPGRTVLLRKVLAVALVIVTVLPILIFATDFTNSHLLQSARQVVRERERAQQRSESTDARRERIRLRRAEIHPTVATVVMAMTFQLLMLAAIAVVGRRLFALRL